MNREFLGPFKHEWTFFLSFTFDGSLGKDLLTCPVSLQLPRKVPISRANLRYSLLLNWVSHCYRFLWDNWKKKRHYSVHLFVFSVKVKEKHRKFFDTTRTEIFWYNKEGRTRVKKNYTHYEQLLLHFFYVVYSKTPWKELKLLPSHFKRLHTTISIYLRQNKTLNRVIWIEIKTGIFSLR